MSQEEAQGSTHAGRQTPACRAASNSSLGSERPGRAWASLIEYLINGRPEGFPRVWLRDAENCKDTMGATLALTGQ